MQKMKHEEYGAVWKDYWARKNGEKPQRKPLRSFKKLCDELNVSPASLRGKMSRFNAPKPILEHKNAKINRSYYDPDAFKLWWATLLEKKHE
jgi:hypothetical protein